MTAVRKTTDRAGKRMRYIARALALSWAGLWTFNVAAATWLIALEPVSERNFTVESWLTIAALVLIAWASAAVAWRWGIGGVVVALVGLLTSTWGWGLLFPAVHFQDYTGMLSFLPCFCLSYVTALLALLAGALFLASWWKSSRSSIRLRLLGIGLLGLGALSFLVLCGGLVGNWLVVDEMSAYHATATAESYATATALVARSRNVELVGWMPDYDARDVFVRGQYAYVAAGWDGLRVVDVSDPTAPVEVGSYARQRGFASGVFVSDSYAYVLDGSSLRVVDVSDPTAPVQVGFYSAGTDSYDYDDICVAGSYAYVATALSGLRVIDISDPTAPVEVELGRYVRGGHGVFVSNSYAYVADGWRELRVVDISDPTAPVDVGSYDTGGPSDAVYVSDSYAYVAGSLALQVVDVSNPTAPMEVGSCPALGRGVSVFVAGSYAYVAELGLQVVDVSNPATPLEVGFYPTPGEGGKVYVSGPCAYLANGDGGLFILRFVQD